MQSKIPDHIKLLKEECNKVHEQLKTDNYTVNELINANKRANDLVSAIQFMEALQQADLIKAAANNRIVTPANGMKVL